MSVDLAGPASMKVRFLWMRGPKWLWTRRCRGAEPGYVCPEPHESGWHDAHLTRLALWVLS